jgi:hypothetical protein
MSRRKRPRPVGGATFSDAKWNGRADNKSVVIEIKSGAKTGMSGSRRQPTPLQAFRATMGIARKMTSGEIKVTAEGQTIAAKGIESAWSGDPVTGAGKTTMSLTDLVILKQHCCWTHRAN